MKCTNCGTDLTDDMFGVGMCFSCGCPVSKSEKAFEYEQDKIRAAKLLEEQKKKELKEKLYNDRLSNQLLTTGFSFEGYRINEYLGIVDGETILGTGYFSDINASVSDFFGVEATEYSDKLHQAKQAVLRNMIKASADLGGNAIVGISYGYMTFSGNMIGVSVTGTSVKAEKLPSHSDNSDDVT